MPRRADIARRRLVGSAASRAAEHLGTPLTQEARADLGLSLTIYDAENGYGPGVGIVTARRACRDRPALLLEVLAALDGADQCEAGNRASRARAEALRRAARPR